MTRCRICPLPGARCKEWRAINKGDQCVECGHFSECHQRHKYGAKPQEMDGHKFASTAERDRYVELKLMEQAGLIQNLKLQPRYPLFAGPDEKTVATYVADFEYRESVDGASILITEDSKGFRTPIFKLKARFFAACYGREIRETSAGRTRPRRSRAAPIR